MKLSKLSYKENNLRIVELIEFRGLVVTYFNNTRKNSIFQREVVELEAAKEVRPRINSMLQRVMIYVQESGAAAVILWSPAPAVGGYRQSVHLIQNIFNLDRFEISPLQLVDTIEQAIGIFESNRKSSLMRSLNPLFWFGRVLSWIAGIPFSILEDAGLHGKKLEENWIGRILKLLVELSTAVVAIFGALKVLGLDGKILTLLHLSGS